MFSANKKPIYIYKISLFIEKLQMKGWVCHSEGVKFLIYSVLQLKFDNPIEWLDESN